MTVVLLVVSLLLFVLAAVTDGISSASPLDLIAAGLALFVAAALIGSLPPRPGG